MPLMDHAATDLLADPRIPYHLTLRSLAVFAIRFQVMLTSPHPEGVRESFSLSAKRIAHAMADMTLLLNLRPGEVVVRTVRDVDDGGTRLRVRKAKTRAGDRDIKLPDVLQPLIAARCVGKRPDELLFPTVDGEGETVPHPPGSRQSGGHRRATIACGATYGAMRSYSASFQSMRSAIASMMRSQPRSSSRCSS